jgi:signal transduction histidine kinase
MSGEVSEAVIIVLAGTFLMLILVIFIISFFFIHQRRQTAHRLEKASLKAQYESEILNAENEIQEQTMKDISRELHDNVGQMLTLVKIQLNNMAVEQPDNARLKNSKEFLHTALTDIRSLSKTLNNENLLAEGLSKAIAFDLDRLQRTGIFKTHLYDNYQGQMLDYKKEIVVFRMFQELTQNIMKHAQAKNISVNLVETKESFNLELIDDGIGFDFEAKINQKGFNEGTGLRNLVHRAQLLGGKIAVNRAETGGTITRLTIPNIIS